MKFSKWSYKNAAFVNLLPTIVYRPLTKWYGYTTEPRVDPEGNKYSVRVTPYTETSSRSLQLAWLWCSCSFSWEEKKLLTEEESIAYEQNKQS